MRLQRTRNRTGDEPSLHLGVRAHRLRLALTVLLGGLLCATLLVSGCAGDRVQSMLHPAAPEAERIAGLWWFMFVVGSAVFLATMGLLTFALLRRPRVEREQPPMGSSGFIVVAGIIVPAIILVILLFVSLDATVALRLPTRGMTIQVVGHQWWWEVRYPEQGFITANEIHIPAGEPVLLELWSADVIHSFWVPRLHGKMDLIPEHTNKFWIQAAEPGTYRGQCAEYCGLQHALMAFSVVALPRHEFDQWVVEQQTPPPAPTTPELLRGQQVFFEAACHNCHAIGGTEAVARIGPDLSNMGARRTIGAGTLPNNPGNLAGWIVDPQAIKPGNLMPPSRIESQDLHALRLYLESLR